MAQKQAKTALAALEKLNSAPPLGETQAALPAEIKEMHYQLSNADKHLLTGPQLRAARGLADWTRSQLAAEAHISPETIKNIEHGTFRPGEQTANAIIETFAKYGVQFFHLPFLNVAGVAVSIPKSDNQLNKTVQS
jgi:DNA-binding XRE family transcriptional regulator